MNRTIGFIGGGNMGEAMISGLIKSKTAVPDQIIVFDVDDSKMEYMNEVYGIVLKPDVISLTKDAEILVLAVKPAVYPSVIREIREVVDQNAIIITIAAGQKLKCVERLFGRKLKVARVMPNIPALVGEAMSAVATNHLITDEDIMQIESLLNSFGTCEKIPEELMDSVTAVSGSSPAYIYVLIEAMADGAVQEGMPRSQAYRFAAQAVYGSAKMVLESKKHPGELKDMVCSPGGTTISAVAELERKGFRAAVLSAMAACAVRSRKMLNKESV